MFVGMTRAREELQFSLARYREFRGARRMSVPSQFLLELPREELDMTEMLFADAHWEADEQGNEAVHEESGEMGDDSQTDRADSADVEFASPPANLRLTTAAAMVEAATIATAAPPKFAVSPDHFQQGMVVQHPEYGLGKITAIDGQGPKRAATVLFASTAGERRFYLIHSHLMPAKMG